MKHLLAATLLGASIAAGQTPAKRPMTFADLQAMKRVSDPQISPSGKWVLFSVTDVVLEKNSKTNHLWTVPLEGSRAEGQGRSERQVTTGSGESNGRFSPDGRWVMYSSSEGGSAQIWLAPWDEAAGRVGAGHAVTALETEAEGAIWAPDSQHILFTSSVYPECESKAPMGPQRNEEEANCNALKDAVEAKNPVKARIFDSLLYRHWNQFMGPKHSHIFYADAMSGTHVVPTDLTPASVVGDHEAPTFTVGGPLGYAISPDGKEIAYSVNLDKVPAESTNNDIFVLQVGAEPSTAKKVSTSPGSDDGPQYSPDGHWLGWRSQARNGYESDKFDLVVMERATGVIRNLTTEFDGWVDAFTWIDDSQHLWFSTPFHGYEVLARTNVTGDDLHTMPEGGGEWGDFTAKLIAGREHAIGTRMWVDHPTEIFDGDALRLEKNPAVVIIRNPNVTPLASRNIVKSGRVTEIEIRDGQLSHLNDAILPQIEILQQESFWFTGANNTKVQGFLVKPPNFDPAKKYPVKFLIHGGPQGAWGDAWSYRWNPELFAAEGYVVVMVNPRGSTGYGQKFLEEVSGDWGGRAYEDLMKGLDYAEQHYPFIDKSRECALGASYGGFMADWILTHTDRFKCIVTHDGMYNPQSAFGTTEELWFNEWEFRPLATTPSVLSFRSVAKGPASHDAGAGDAVVEQSKPAHPWDFYDKPASEDPFRKWSPMLAVKNAHTPTLVVHSQRDYRLDVSEGMQLFTALQLLGVPSKMLYFPDEGHWVTKPKNSELWYQTVNDWCDRWTGMGKYASLGPEKNPAAVSKRASKRTEMRDQRSTWAGK